MEKLTKHVISLLSKIVGPENLKKSLGDRMVYESDAYTLSKGLPDVVVLPETTEQVQNVIKICNQYQIPFVPRGAGTSLAGCAIPSRGGVLLSLTRMNRILDVNIRNRYALVEPGVVNARLSHHLRGTGFHYAPDPSSQGACTIGGNVATNSGGPHTLKYGVTVNHVLGLEVVLPDGEIIIIGGPVKGLAGYDLTGLMVGAEGTLGVCTKIWVRLTPDPSAYRTLLGVFSSVEDASQAIAEIISAGVVPAALEMMDNLMIQAVEEAFQFGFPLDAGAVLIIEIDGLEAGIDTLAQSISSIASSHHATEVRLAKDDKERALLWKSRKKAFGAIGRLSPSYCCQDGVVPRSKIPEMLSFIGEVSQKYDLRIANVFHAGDGNLHPILLFDERNHDEIEKVILASEEILDQCIALGGSVTGEHGIGVEKISFMSKLFSEHDIQMMKSIRSVFGAHTLCNPGKMLPDGASCLETRLPARRRAT